MAIEDVDYLYKHSIKKSYMFYIDSKDRDKTIFPHPNNYSITFSAPFRNVYSLEILDASIPRTQYAVDVHNNTLNYSFNNSTFTEIHIPVGDYSDKNLIAVINDAFKNNNCDIYIQNLSIPADERSTFVFYASKPFKFDMENSLLRTVLGFDLYAFDNDVDELQNVRYFPESNHIYGSVSSDTSYKQINVYEGPLNTSVAFQLNSTTTPYIFADFSPFLQSYNAIAQTFYINDESMFDSLMVYFNDYRSFTCGVSYYQVDEDNYTKLSDLPTSLTKSAGNLTAELSLNDTSLRIGKYLIVIYLNALTSNQELSGPSDINVCVNLKSSDEDTQAFVLQYDGYITQEKFDLTDYNVCMTIKTKQHLHKIEAPGMYNLIGDRYAILRCPEIEQHIFASHSFEKYSMGLAKFKLAVLGYDESRFDFASLPPREFHPIGKLTQMTLSFVRPDGGLYNFRGINHTITMAIRYLVPNQRGDFDKFILNPKYDPDFFRYQQNQESESDSDSDV